MPDPESNNERKRRLLDALLLLIGLLLLVIGIGIHPPTDPAHTALEFFALFLEHLGIGLFAVTVLKVFIEEAAQKHFMDVLRKDVKNQVSTTVISFIRRGSWILNNQVLKKELEDSILLPDFTRPYYNLKLKLEPLENHAEFFKVWITLEYEVKNVSDKPKVYHVSTWFEDIIKLDGLAPDSQPGFKSIEIGSTPYNLEKQSDGTTKVGTGTILCDEYMVHLKDLPTPVIKDDESVVIRIEGMQIMRSADHFVWNLPTITHKLNLSIELAGGLTFDQLAVCPREMHHVSHQEFLDTLDKRTPNTWKLRIEHVVLPFQGIELRWVLKPLKASDRTEVPTAATVSSDTVTQESIKDGQG